MTRIGGSMNKLAISGFCLTLCAAAGAQTVDEQLLAAQIAYQQGNTQLSRADAALQQAQQAKKAADARLVDAQNAVQQSDAALTAAIAAQAAAKQSMDQLSGNLSSAWQRKDSAQ